MEPRSVEAWALPASFAVAAAVGIVYGVWLRSARPDIYQGIGMGAEGAVGPAPVVPVSDQAEPAGAG